MARKTSHISILQFDERRISWVRISRSSRGIHVLDSAQERGEWAAEKSLQTALKEFAGKHKLAEDVLYTVLPRHDMTARIMLLPSQDPEEIAGMVELSAGELVPYAAEELAIDQCILHKTADGEARVLAVLAHRDIVEGHLQLLEQVGLEPEQIYLSSACLASAAIAARPKCEERYALVNLASGGLEAVVVNGHQLEYGRGIASAQDWGLEGEQAEEALHELATEVQASLSAYRRESEDGLGPEVVYLCSDWADVRGPAESLTQETGLECSPAEFAQGLVIRGARRLEGLPLVALGAALTAQGRAAVAINLIPEAYLRRRGRARIQRKAIKAGVLVVLVLAAAFGLYHQAVRQRMAMIRDLERRIAEVEPYAEGVVTKHKQLQILEEQVKHDGTVLELLAALCKVAPDSGLNITRITFEHDRELNVWGRAETLNEVDQFTEALRELGKMTYPQFANARRLYELEIYERNKQIYSYAIGIPFPGEEEEEAED